jgi:hypothetical protein
VPQRHPLSWTSRRDLTEVSLGRIHILGGKQPEPLLPSAGDHAVAQRRWRARLREAVDIAARRAVIADWAVAAGGRVERDLLILPSDLPLRLASVEMTAMASCVRIRREVLR